MMNHFFRNTAFLLAILLLSMPLYVLAQPGFDPGVPDGAPVDGGLSILAIAGVTYAARKFHAKRKKSNDPSEE